MLMGIESPLLDVGVGRNHIMEHAFIAVSYHLMSPSGKALKFWKGLLVSNSIDYCMLICLHKRIVWQWKVPTTLQKVVSLK